MTSGAFYDAQDPAVRALIQRHIRSGRVSMALLVSFDFTSGIVRLCNRTVDVVDGDQGHTWQPLLANIVWQDIEGGPQNWAPVRTYSLTVPSDWSTRFGAAVGPFPSLDDKRTYQGRAAVMSLQLLLPGEGPSGTDAPLGRPSVLHKGTMDKISKELTLGGVRHDLRVEGFLARKGVPGNGTLTPRDQKARYPHDLGLDYVSEAAVREPVWPKYT